MLANLVIARLTSGTTPPSQEPSRPGPNALNARPRLTDHPPGRTRGHVKPERPVTGHPDGSHLPTDCRQFATTSSSGWPLRSSKSRARPRSRPSARRPRTPRSTARSRPVPRLASEAVGRTEPAHMDVSYKRRSRGQVGITTRSAQSALVSGPSGRPRRAIRRSRAPPWPTDAAHMDR